MRIGVGGDGHLLNDTQTIAVEPHSFARVVRQQAELTQPQILQNLSTDAVVAAIGRQSEGVIGFNRI